MKELIKITEREGMQAVSARELHAFLASKQDFSDWMKNRINKYGFIENQDYTRFHKNMETTGGRLIEYILTLDCAKELAMVEGNAKGRQARKYFIERDKELRAMERGELKLSEVERLIRLESRLKRIEASQITSEVHDFTVFGYASFINKKLYGSEAMTIGKRAAKCCRKLKLPIGKIVDHRYGWLNTYPTQVLEVVFDDFFKQPRF